MKTNCIRCGNMRLGGMVVNKYECSSVVIEV